MTDEDYWHWAASEWKTSKTPQELINLLISGYEINNEVVKIVQTSRKIGYKNLICTNNFPARINGLNKRFNFLNNFDAWVFSYEVGCTKPDTLIFEELVKRANLEASEIIFADDNEENIKGAQEVGINAFFYENFDQFVSELKNLGVQI